jgi:hypothetical protein
MTERQADSLMRRLSLLDVTPNDEGRNWIVRLTYPPMSTLWMTTRGDPAPLSLTSPASLSRHLPAERKLRRAGASPDIVSDTDRRNANPRRRLDRGAKGCRSPHDWSCSRRHSAVARENDWQ